MLTPMELMSTITTRTDSGEAVRKRGDGSDLNFGQMLGNELEKNQSQEQLVSSPKPADEDTNPVVKDEKGEVNERVGEEYVAGVMGNQQQNVVFILEGDSKPVINQMHFEDVIEPPEPIITEEIKPEVLMPGTITHEENKSFATVLQANAAETEDAKAKLAEVINIKDASGATARMPNMRTQESQNYSNNENEESMNGNLSPLENENEVEMQKGQKGFTQTAEAVREVAEAKTVREEQQTTNDMTAPPISESIKVEQFTAKEQIKSEAMYAPVKPENLFEEMISRVQTMQSENISTMKIQLNPEWLGNMALEVGIDAQGLHIRINAEDSGIRGIVNGQITALIESLEEKGLEIAEIEVVNTSVGYDTTKDPHESSNNSRQTQRNSRQRFRSEVDSKDGVALYTTMSKVQEYYLDTGVSSVEYSA